MNSTTTPDFEMMAKAYFSDKIAIALGSQFMGYVRFFPFVFHPSIFPHVLTRINRINRTHQIWV
jgi:hypothetical protein